MSSKRGHVWYKGNMHIKCELIDVKKSLMTIGEHFTNTVSLMPGLTSVKLINQGEDYVIIETNEGLMKRTKISIELAEDKLIIQFDEEYKAGKAITTYAHFYEEFTSNEGGVNYHLEITDLTAPGFMGFFYRNFGSKSTGSAFLNAHKKSLEK